MTAEFADVSVGVLEGDPAMNTLIIRTERGERAVNEAIRDGYIEAGDIPADNLEHLKIAAGRKKRRAMMKAEGEGRINTARGGRALLRLADACLREIVTSKGV